MSGKVLPFIRPGMQTPVEPPSFLAPPSRRALYRVRTASLDLRATVRNESAVLRGRLQNISAGGCCIRVALPLPTAITQGSSVTVTLLTGDTILVCAGEIVGIDPQGSAVHLRLRFRSLAPGAHRTLLAWIARLAAQDFQRRHAQGDAGDLPSETEESKI